METVGNEQKKNLFSFCNGFTIIEVMIAMIVLSVGVLAIAGMQISAIKGNSQASKITMATALLEEKLAGYKIMPYQNIVDEKGVKNVFSWASTVDSNTPANGLKTITVKASWTEGGRPHELAFSTIVSK